LNYVFLAPQVAPISFKLKAVSPYCVSVSYDPVFYPNGPESGLVYQVNTQHSKILIVNHDACLHIFYAKNKSIIVSLFQIANL